MFRSFILVPIYIFISVNLQAQLFSKKLNNFNEEGLKEGLWKIYWDEEKNVPMSKAHYKDGRETGVNKEYHISGKLRLKSRYDKKRIRVKYYYENRKLDKKGWAIMEYNENDIHYYWHGKWKYYNENGKLIKIADYRKGKIVDDTLLVN
ncbi:MAG: hypothetical protein K8S16_15025 [Bacteroidales bacterium]|nr:hypothetical protein [Bacteroidales bacterium]